MGMGTDFPSINPNVGIPKIITNGAENFVATPSSNGGIEWKILLPTLAVGATTIGFGLNHLLRSNNPQRMSTENIESNVVEPTIINPTNNSKPTSSWWGNTWHFTKCTLQEWFSEGSDECAAFLHRSKNATGIGSWFSSLSSTVKTLLIAGVSIPVVVYLLKSAFDIYARTGRMTVPGNTSVVKPEIKPTINPQIDPHINPTINPQIDPHINPTINPKINPQINPNIISDIDNEYEPDYNPNLMQNYVPTINVMRENKQPQIVIQPKGHVFVPYEPGYKSKPKIKNKNSYSWLLNDE